MRDQYGEETAEPSRGIQCPKCGCRHMVDPQPPNWHVTNTYQRQGYIRRRRVCRNCGRVVYTREILEMH